MRRLVASAHLARWFGRPGRRLQPGRRRQPHADRRAEPGHAVDRQGATALFREPLGHRNPRPVPLPAGLVEKNGSAPARGSPHRYRCRCRRPSAGHSAPGEYEPIGSYSPGALCPVIDHRYRYRYRSGDPRASGRNRFFPPTRPAKLTGLGLSMAKGFAEQSGGGLTIESRARKRHDDPHVATRDDPTG